MISLIVDLGVKHVLFLSLLMLYIDLGVNHVVLFLSLLILCIFYLGFCCCSVMLIMFYFIDLHLIVSCDFVMETVYLTINGSNT